MVARIRVVEMTPKEGPYPRVSIRMPVAIGPDACPMSQRLPKTPIEVPYPRAWLCSATIATVEEVTIASPKPKITVRKKRVRRLEVKGYNTKDTAQSNIPTVINGLRP